ncbi:Uncharacterised protein [Streptococcus pneumoniae]|nr:Uncharacterised protein [Streptococcus pneumoniae]CJC49262.1 Uncharacterised protein [Streptococcus pneumoniae]CJC91773.1 Uncharacterised protein [Streptococcus pneumoniae]
MKIVPLPIPAQNATSKQPNVYTFILGINDKIIPESVKPINTKINILNGLNLSPSQPPIGRIIVASTMNPAVRIPASTFSNPK